MIEPAAQPRTLHGYNFRIQARNLTTEHDKNKHKDGGRMLGKQWHCIKATAGSICRKQLS